MYWLKEKIIYTTNDFYKKLKTIDSNGENDLVKN